MAPMAPAALPCPIRGRPRRQARLAAASRTAPVRRRAAGRTPARGGAQAWGPPAASARRRPANARRMRHCLPAGRHRLPPPPVEPCPPHVAGRMRALRRWLRPGSAPAPWAGPGRRRNRPPRSRARAERSRTRQDGIIGLRLGRCLLLCLRRQVGGEGIDDGIERLRGLCLSGGLRRRNGSVGGDRRLRLGRLVCHRLWIGGLRLRLRGGHRGVSSEAWILPLARQRIARERIEQRAVAEHVAPGRRYDLGIAQPEGGATRRVGLAAPGAALGIRRRLRIVHRSSQPWCTNSDPMVRGKALAIGASLFPARPSSLRLSPGP